MRNRLLVAALVTFAVVASLTLAGDKQKTMGERVLTDAMAPLHEDASIPKAWGRVVGYGVTLYGPGVTTEYVLLEAEDGTLRRVAVTSAGKMYLQQIIRRP